MQLIPIKLSNNVFPKDNNYLESDQYPKRFHLNSGFHVYFVVVTPHSCGRAPTWSRTSWATACPCSSSRAPPPRSLLPHWPQTSTQVLASLGHSEIQEHPEVIQKRRSWNWFWKLMQMLQIWAWSLEGSLLAQTVEFRGHGSTPVKMEEKVALCCSLYAEP